MKFHCLPKRGGGSSWRRNPSFEIGTLAMTLKLSIPKTTDRIPNYLSGCVSANEVTVETQINAPGVSCIGVRRTPPITIVCYETEFSTIVTAATWKGSESAAIGGSGIWAYPMCSACFFHSAPRYG